MMGRNFLRLVAAVGICAALSGCARDLHACGKTYTSYGLLSPDDARNQSLRYEVIWGNVFLGVIMFETIIAPIYFFGFSIFEPVGAKPTEPGTAPGAPVCKEHA
jgi:hypothetical protein